MPFDRSKYPPDWETISLSIRRDRAEWRCECTGQCGRDHGGRCPRRHGEAIPETLALLLFEIDRDDRPVTVLTTMHLDHDPSHCDPANLLAACQRCHLLYDLQHHLATARRTRERRRQLMHQPGLFNGDDK